MRLQKLKDRLPPEKIIEMIDTIGLIESSSKLYAGGGGRYQLLKLFRDQFNEDNDTSLTAEDMEDPLKSTMVMAHYINSNYKEGDELIDVYLKHHFGPSGGRAILNAPKDKKLTEVLDTKVFDRNKYIKNEGLETTKDLIDFWEKEIPIRASSVRQKAKTQYMLSELGYYNRGIDALDGEGTSKGIRELKEKTGMSTDELNQMALEYYDKPYEEKIQMAKYGSLRQVSDLNLGTTEKYISDVYNIYENNDYDFSKAIEETEDLRNHYYTGTNYEEVQGIEDKEEKYKTLSRGLFTNQDKYAEEREAYYSQEGIERVPFKKEDEWGPNPQQETDNEGQGSFQ